MGVRYSITRSGIFTGIKRSKYTSHFGVAKFKKFLKQISFFKRLHDPWARGCIYVNGLSVPILPQL